MIRTALAATALAPLFALAHPFVVATPLAAQVAEPQAAPSPNEIVAQADAGEWIAIAPEDLLVMTLAPDRDGQQRQVVIQLMPAPFSQGWVENIRTLARDQWYDGIAVVRVQDNYVVQWGDPDGEDDALAKPLPGGLRVMTQREYAADAPLRTLNDRFPGTGRDDYAENTAFIAGFPVGFTIYSPPPGTTPDRFLTSAWPIHCYGMVGVGRDYSPDTGTGAELYTVIGHAPRHLDRNIALVGRVVEGIEHLSSLPRGTGPLGFYEDEAQRVPILSLRVAADLPAAERPRFEYLSTEGATFARYAEARANRRDPFFIVPAGGADICNIPVPVRPVTP